MQKGLGVSTFETEDKRQPLVPSSWIAGRNVPVGEGIHGERQRILQGTRTFPILCLLWSGSCDCPAHCT